MFERLRNRLFKKVERYKVGQRYAARGRDGQPFHGTVTSVSRADRGVVWVTLTGARDGHQVSERYPAYRIIGRL